MFCRVVVCGQKPAIDGAIQVIRGRNCCPVLHAVTGPDLYIMEVKKDEKGTLRAVLKDTAVKDWQDPYHQECPMKW
jgi:hypothetical protein